MVNGCRLSDPVTSSGRLRHCVSVRVSTWRVRGAFQSGNLGYWVAEGHQGQGLASAAVAVVCEFAAEVLGLHRIQAGTLIRNVASQRVLERCEFTRIGVAPQYLSIDGVWEDHILFQRILHG